MTDSESGRSFLFFLPGSQASKLSYLRFLPSFPFGYSNFMQIIRLGDQHFFQCKYSGQC